MKENILKWSSLFSLFLAATLMVSCQGDDGAIGPAGTSGTNGTNGTSGTNGTNGTNGKDGLGFKDALAYGKITVEFVGQRPDGVDFTHTVEFPYAPSDLRSSALYRAAAPSDDHNQVSLTRYQEGIDGPLNNNEGSSYYSCTAYSNISNTEGVYEIEFDGASFETSVEFPDEKAYFNLGGYTYYFGKYIDESGNPYYGGYLNDAEIISFPTNPGNTGKITFKYTGTVPSSYNSTGYDLKVTVTADVSIVENIGKGNQEGRISAAPKSNGKEASQSKKIAKVQMLPM
jgi:hypothetical protein